MKAEVYTGEGLGSGKKVDLPDAIFGIEPNDHLIYQAVVTEMENRRSGTHFAKTRSEVRGGGRKPWRQKGTGRARAGTIRSPLWTGGGVTFPPKPHKYKKQMNVKAKRLARRSAFSYKAIEKQVYVIEDLEFEEPKTKRLAGLLKDMELADQKILLLTGEYDRSLYLSGNNLPYLSMKKAQDASTYDILDCTALVLTKSGLAALSESLGNNSEK